MLTTLLVGGAVWACVAVVVGLFVGRRLRQRTPAVQAAERLEIRKGA